MHALMPRLVASVRLIHTQRPRMTTIGADDGATIRVDSSETFKDLVRDCRVDPGGTAVLYDEENRKPLPPVLACFSSEQCTRCPPFMKRVRELAEHYEFRVAYVAMPHAEDVAHEYGICRLPAYIPITACLDDDAPTVVQGVDALERVAETVKTCFKPRFVTDADF